MQTFAASKIPDELILRAEEAGIRLEIQGDLPLWETSPRPLHQKAQFAIMNTIEPIPSTDGRQQCQCFFYHDINIRFPDGSIKVPDISIFCGEIDENQLTVTRVPDAIIEILSPRGELKDLELGPPFYLSFGVKDVVILSPETRNVVHRRTERTTHHTSPVTLDLECGCRVTV